MSKIHHEIRDPIHTFIRLDNLERRVLDSRPFQRLRYIHQLALTYLVYPGATHRRFEHSLGVMELAGRVFDIVTHPQNITDGVKELFSDLSNEDSRRYWRRVVRMAALCHDIGHLPFSHAAEKDLLPEKWDHERLTKELILSPEMKEIFEEITPPLRPEDVVRLSVGQKKAPEYKFTDWEAILSEIIVGDAFGVDRIDYLLRDSYHAGVSYGRFDHFRLIDTLRILPPPGYKTGKEQSREPYLGVESGGIQSAEALLLARYFMYSQVYFHPVRRIYDIHLKDFLKEWLPGGVFPTELEKHLSLTDNEIISGLRATCDDSSSKACVHAERIIKRRHFKLLYSKNPPDIEMNPSPHKAIYKAAVKKFGEECVKYDEYTQKGGVPDFPVQIDDGRIVSSFSLSQTLAKLPIVSVGYVFIEPKVKEEAMRWVEENRKTIIESNGD